MNKIIKIISDTHCLHRHLKNEDLECDVLIHCGDSTNSRNIIYNQSEFDDFIDWYIKVPVDNKVLIAGNHCTWATKKYNIDYIKEKTNINYLCHEAKVINDLLIFGSPYTPLFRDWNFMMNRSKLSRYWEAIPENLDILVTHGPPKGVLDVAKKSTNEIEYCGDNALLKMVKKVKPKIHCFGHIHNNHDIINYGVLDRGEGTKYVNASMIKDGSFGKGLSNKPITINA